MEPVEDFSLHIHDGEFMVFVGPSGCGKTTALRMIAGLERISEGELRIGARVVNGLAPRERDVAMVFQNFALYPQMSVYDNIGFGLRIKHVAKKERDERVREIAKVLGLTDLLLRKPKQLSGGQRQRVAMGRAIVREPSAFLMDEPLSNLDAKLRVQMRSEIARIQRQVKATTIYVTHDQVEAMTMGDRVALLRRGVLQQVGPPQELYESPVNLFVASFIGSPAMNLLSGRLEQREGRLACLIGEQALSVPPQLQQSGRLASYVGRDVAVGIRPEHLEDAALKPDAPADCRLRGRAQIVEALGSEYYAHLELEAVPILSQEVLEVASDIDAAAVDELRAAADARRAVIVCRFDAASRAQTGDNIDVAVDVRKLQFFDPETGASLLLRDANHRSEQSMRS